ncbi:hypothetical protein GC163_20215 [bacterium]|nr:hypothetical protein [bacterium]
MLLLVEGGKLIWLERAGPAPVAYDAAGYWQLGTQVARGDVWMTADAIGYRTPGYPWLIGVCQWLCGSSAWRAISILQHLCLFITTGLTAWWTWRLTSRVWLVNLALLIRVLSLGSASYAETLLTETVYLPVLTLTMILLTTSRDVINWRTWCGICGLWSLSFLIRPSSVALLPVLVLALALPSWSTGFSRIAVRRLASRLAVGGVIAAVMIGPWCVRNALIFGRPTPVIFLGRELWISILGPGRPIAPSLPDSPDMERIRELTATSQLEIQWENNWSVSHALTDAGLTDAQADDLQQKVAWQALWRDPLRAVLRMSWKAVDFWRVVYDREQALYGDKFTPETTLKGQSMWGQVQQRERRTQWLSMAPEHQLLVMELGSLLGLMGTLGLCLSPRHWSAGLVCMTTLVMFCGITAVLDAPSYRYRMILEPLLITGGCAGFAIWRQVMGIGTKNLWNSVDLPQNVCND